MSIPNPYLHSVIDHAVAYAEGRIHTSGMENFWSLLKRGISGTYVRVEPFHLEPYLDEQAYRSNHRKEKDAERFVGTVAAAIGRHVTYQELTGKVNLGISLLDRQGRGKHYPKEQREGEREHTRADAVPAI